MKQEDYAVHIISIDGKPLMPTKRFGKVNRMLKNGQAKVVKKSPFTIQLLYRTKTEFVQSINTKKNKSDRTERRQS